MTNRKPNLKEPKNMLRTAAEDIANTDENILTFVVLDTSLIEISRVKSGNKAQQIIPPRSDNTMVGLFVQ